VKKKIIFLSKFFGIFFVLEYIIMTCDFSFLQEFIAQTIALILNLESNGSIIFTQKGNFEIVSSCTGLVSGSVLASIVFSLKKPELNKKIELFLTGFVILLILNYFRVLLVVEAGAMFGTMIAEALHVISWFSTAIIVLFLWYKGTKKVTKVQDFEGFL